MKSGIYSITNIINGKKLIGQAKNISHRWEKHKYLLQNNIHYNTHFQNAWNKYGQHNFVFGIILTCDVADLDREEIRLIRENKSSDRRFGYNIEMGGKYLTMSEETKKKISMSQTGNKNWNYGKTLSEETKEKIRNAMKGNKNCAKGRAVSQETRTKLRLALSGKKLQLSEEARRKISEANRRRICPMLGRRLSEETKNKISKTLKERLKNHTIEDGM